MKRIIKLRHPIYGRGTAYLTDDWDAEKAKINERGSRKEEKYLEGIKFDKANLPCNVGKICGAMGKTYFNSGNQCGGRFIVRRWHRDFVKIYSECKVYFEKTIQ